MDQKRKELLLLLKEAEAFLRQYGEPFWADWLLSDASRIQEHDPEGLVHLLRAFGGMGSFTDLCLWPENGYPIKAHEVSPVNERLKELRGAIYVRAKALQLEEA